MFVFSYHFTNIVIRMKFYIHISNYFNTNAPYN